MSLLFRMYAGIYDGFMKRFGLDDNEPILKHFNGVTGRKICDVGGGTGLLADELSRSGNDVTIVDPCVRMTNIAKNRNKNIKVVSGTIEDCLNKGPYDYIILKDVLHHITDQTKLIRVCLSLLKEDGSLLIQDFSPEHSWTKMIFLFERFCMERIRPVNSKKLAGYVKKRGMVGKIHVINGRDYLYVGRKIR